MAAEESFKIDSFKTNFNTGARSYLFYVDPTFPSGITTTTNAKYLVKSSSLPESTLEEILTNWQGYDYKQAGKHTFNDWTVSFNVDRNASVYHAYIKWIELIHNPYSNVHSLPTTYFINQSLQLLGLDGNPILTYTLWGAWPKSVGAVTLDYSQNEIATFDVTFSYMRHEVVQGGNTAPSATTGTGVTEGGGGQ